MPPLSPAEPNRTEAPPDGTVRHRPLLRVALLVVAVLLLTAAWRWTAIGDWLAPEVLTVVATDLRQAVWGPPAGLVAFVLASILAAPATLLILAAALVFGPVTGGLIALLGSTLAALASYGIGRLIGRRLVEELAGGRLARLSRRLARRGLLTIIILRLVPVAPFTIVNLLAGASHIGLRDYGIGTVLGMLPVVLALAIFAQGLLALLAGADLRAVALILVGLLALAGLAWLARRLRPRALAAKDTDA